MAGVDSAIKAALKGVKRGVIPVLVASENSRRRVIRELLARAAYGRYRLSAGNWRREVTGDTGLNSIFVVMIHDELVRNRRAGQWRPGLSGASLIVGGLPGQR